MKRTIPGLRDYFTRYPDLKRKRETKPSDAFIQGLRMRDQQDRASTAAFDRGYFLRNETRHAIASCDANYSWQQEQRERALRGEPFDESLLYIVNPLAAYSFTFGWRTVPGVRWAANNIRKPAEAERFEADIVDWIKIADTLHATLCSYAAPRFLSMAETDFIGPHLTRARNLCETVTRGFEARGVL